MNNLVYLTKKKKKKKLIKLTDLQEIIDDDEWRADKEKNWLLLCFNFLLFLFAFHFWFSVFLLMMFVYLTCFLQFFSSCLTSLKVIYGISLSVYINWCYVYLRNLKRSSFVTILFSEKENIMMTCSFLSSFCSPLFYFGFAILFESGLKSNQTKENGTKRQ